MGRYIAKRLGMMLVLLIGMTFIVFGSLHLASGDPAQMVAGASATEEDIAAVRTSLGLDQPFWVQYGRYLKRLDGGPRHVIHHPPTHLPGNCHPPSLHHQLACAAIILAIVIGIPWAF